jgi:hypothetical protein
MKLNEGQINGADAKEVFKTAEEYSKPRGLAKVFKGFRQPQITANDLQQAWKDAKFPDDSRDIAAILKDHGYDAKAIKAIFTKVFDAEATEVGGETSPVIQQIADYAKENGLADDLKVFLQKEYGFTESYGYEGKVMVEDIRQIFTSIVHEERRNRERLIREQDQTLLGRTKK